MSSAPHRMMRMVILGMSVALLLGMLSNGSDSETTLIPFLLAPIHALATMIEVMLAPIIVAVVGVWVSVMAAIARHHKSYPVTTFTRGARFSRARKVSSISECVNCGKESCPGYVNEYGAFSVIAGFQIGEAIHGTVHECVGCHEADSIEYALRAEREDPDVPEVPEAEA